MKYKNKIKGFTLIETVVYIGLLGLLMTGAVMATYQIIQSSASTSGRNNVQEEGGFVLRKIVWALGGMASFTLPSAVELVITKYDGTTVDIKLSAGKIVMRENGGVFLPLTTDNVKVESFAVTNIPAVGSGPSGVIATLVMNGTTFSTSRYIRK